MLIFTLLRHKRESGRGLEEDILDEYVISLLVREAKCYAQQRKLRLAATKDEDKCFPGIPLNGHTPLPLRRMLWETLQDSRNERVANAMRRDGLEAIFTNMNVADHSR